MLFFRKSILFFSFLGVLSGHLLAQESPYFTSSGEEFVIKVRKHLLSYENKTFEEKTNQLMNGFEPVWLSDRFSLTEKDSLVSLANRIYDKRFRVNPSFFNYIKAITLLGNSSQTSEGILSWSEYIRHLLKDNSKRNINDFIGFTIVFLSEKILNKTRSTEWRYKNATYKFIYELKPLVKFEEVDLVCTTGKDSSVIEKSSGVFDINELQWEGKKGRIFWTRVGWENDKVYADIINRYSINIKDSKFNIDSVSFTNQYFFNQSILGHLKERVLSSKPNKRTSYPRFRSYMNNHFIEGVFKNINYEGGIFIKGAQFIGAGTSDSPASVIFLRENSDFITVRSSDFVINREKIISQNASVSVYIDNDSVFHPGLNMKYTDAEHKLDLFRSDLGIAVSPFYDTYHKVDIYCDMLAWNLNENKIDLTVKTGLSKEHLATFQSANYFSDYDYYKLQGIDPVNPLNLVSRFSKYYKTDNINLQTFAAFIKKPIEQASAMLYLLASRGFVVYNAEEKTAKIKPRLFSYLDAKAGKIDYDNIRFSSFTSMESNAVLDIETYDLSIRGVSRVALSDSQNVNILPLNGEIVMKKNRDFTFAGNVDAGYFRFYSKEGAFEYDSFRINLPVIDSLSFDVVVRHKDPFKEDSIVRVKNVIADLTGDIVIDLPGNKSGRYPSREFPVFNSRSDSYVYYDYKDICNGAYDRERFYYQLEPFTIKKLDDFDTDDIRFEGFLASDDIVPLIDEALVVLPTFDLGFEHEIPDNGYPVYNDKGEFYNQLKLSNKGLVGTGMLTYLTSVTESSGFVFLLDSMKTEADKFNVLKQDVIPEFPAVEGAIIDQSWLPYEDIMQLSVINNPFLMYENNSEFSGQLELTPDGLTGNGSFKFSNAQVISDLFDFDYITLTADTSDFQLLTETGGDLAIETTDYKSFIDFDSRTGRFEALGRRSVVRFPYNKYISSMDEMLWNMDREEITLINKATSVVSGLEGLTLKERIDVDFTGSEFVSTRPDQDSLAFFCLRATYDMANYVISTDGVQIIRVADAAIFPGDGKVVILENAVMDTLKDADIIADTVNKYHQFYNAIVNITSRHKYHGASLYNYVDKNKEVQPLIMRRISVDENGTTVAKGNISDSSGFYLSPEFYFTGDITIRGKKEYPAFKGGFRLNQECYFTEPTWARLDTVINPDDIKIPAHKKSYNMNGTRNEVGLCRSESSGLFYPAFFTPKAATDDITVIRGSGILTWDDQTSSYFVGSPERIKGTSYLGNRIQYLTNNCVIKGTGLLDLGVDYYPLEIKSLVK